MKAVLVVLALLLAVSGLHVTVWAAGVPFCVPVPVIIIAAELAVLAVITAGIARSAGLRRSWRVRRFVPWTP